MRRVVAAPIVAGICILTAGCNNNESSQSTHHDAVLDNVAVADNQPVADAVLDRPDHNVPVDSQHGT